MVEIKLSYWGGGHKYPNGKTFCSNINRPMFHELVIEMDFLHISIAYPLKFITLTLHHYTEPGISCLDLIVISLLIIMLSQEFLLI